MSFHYNSRQSPNFHTHFATSHPMDNQVSTFSPQKAKFPFQIPISFHGTSGMPSYKNRRRSSEHLSAFVHIQNCWTWTILNPEALEPCYVCTGSHLTRLPEIQERSNKMKGGERLGRERETQILFEHLSTKSCWECWRNEAARLLILKHRDKKHSFNPALLPRRWECEQLN